MDNHVLKQGLQQHFREGVVVVVGSGLSAAEGVPGMGGLATHLLSTIPSVLTEDETAEWGLIGPAIAKIGLEPAFSTNDPSPSLQQKIVSVTAEFIRAHEQAVLDELFSSDRILRLSRLLKFTPVRNGYIPIVTTNYDRLVEFAAEANGLSIDTLFSGAMVGTLDLADRHWSFCRGVRARPRGVEPIYRPRAIVLKPHGSLDWIERNGAPVRYLGNVTSRRPLIIPPGRNKLRSGYDNPFDQHRGEANKYIQSATGFIIIGYGFNDDHLETYLRRALQDGKPALIVSHSLTENAKALVENCKSITAIESDTSGSGSVVHSAAGRHELQGMPLWDVAGFVKEVFNS